MSALFGLLQNSLIGSKASLSSTIDQRMQMVSSSIDNNSNNGDPQLPIWRGDTMLVDTINNIKVFATVLSNDFTKLVILSTTNKSASGDTLEPDPNVVGTLIGEIIPHSDSFVSYFINVFSNITSTSTRLRVSKQLYLLVSKCIMEYYEILCNITTLLLNKKYKDSKINVGKMLEMCEKTIFKQLPCK